ncbi:MAG: hypothetical protein WBP93_22160 [Pyrinomonadaceae bacterium]
MMEEKREPDEEKSGSASDKEEQTGDPGRTPGTAEGDRETVEEDLKEKE